MVECVLTRTKITENKSSYFINVKVRERLVIALSLSVCVCVFNDLLLKGPKTDKTAKLDSKS